MKPLFSPDFSIVQATRTLNGLPGLSDLEGINYLTGDHVSDVNTDEVLVLITPRRLNPAPRVERMLYAGHAPSQGGGSLGPTFDEQHSPAERPLVAPPQQEEQPQPIVVPLPPQQQQPPPRPQPHP